MVAAAKRSEADFLVSLDRRHLVDRPEVARRARIRIVLPEVVLRIIRASGNDP